MNAVSIEHVSKSFSGHLAVDDLCLEVPAGTVYGFIGPNGSGKTTTLRMIMRILHPDEGKIWVLGEHSYGAANDRLGYLPEERGLYKHMKVRELLRFYAALKGFHNSRAAIDDWLQRMDLADWGNKKVQTLSKGMAQKVQFIATVIAKPDLILLDEPFSGLDPVNMDVLRGAILDLKRTGTTVIFSTHDMGVAEKMCDFVFMIYQGRKVLDGTLSEIQRKFGQDTVHVRLEGAHVRPSDVPGVTKVTDLGRCQELRLESGVNPSELLPALMARGEVRHFEVAHPTLHDIFVRIAQPDAKVMAPVEHQNQEV